MAVKQLSDGNPDGLAVGQSSSDLVGLHGATPSARAVATTSAAILTNHSTTAAIFPAFCELRDLLVAKGIISLS